MPTWVPRCCSSCGSTTPPWCFCSVPWWLKPGSCGGCSSGSAPYSADSTFHSCMEGDVFRLALLTLTGAVVSCSKSDRGPAGRSDAALPGLTAADSNAIVAADSAFVTAANGGNVQGVVSVYAIDAALLPPNVPLQRGRAAVRRYWGGLLDAYTIRFEV